jgi:hypothetical protein
MAAEPREMKDEEAVGYKRPPRSTRFQKGKSGNPCGRPRNRRTEIPYDHVLGQMVTIRESGGERRVTAAEAFLLQLTKKGLEGDNAAARALLEALEAARAKREPLNGIGSITRIILMSFSIGSALKPLGLAMKFYPLDEEKVCWKLKPWIVEAALRRLERRLSIDEQRTVVDATHTPDKVNWPPWWEESRG